MAVIVILSPRAAGFLLHFVPEMSRFYAREHCVTHKINALDDFVTTVRPAVRDISLCLRSLRHSAAHVVPCSHMGFKHRTRAGAAIVQKRWRGNKHKQHALSCLEVSLVPMDLCCAITLCSAPHAQQPNPKPEPRMVPIARLHCFPWSTVPAPRSQQGTMGSCCDKLPSSKGTQGVPPRLFCLIASPLTNGVV